jgi:ligand-binding SRPBCC domain-containing protein
MHVLTCHMRAPVSIETAFAVFESPYNLARITPAWLGFRITTPGRVIIREGAEIEYRIGWLGLPLGWKTLFTAYDPPRLFEDEQARGPYSFWRHRHGFEAAPGGTIVSDYVEYALPFGALGRAVHALIVKRQLRQIFEFRQRALIPLLGGDPGQYELSPVAIRDATA